jgi:DMSO/TMAO reductase YedYZ molybdopterin-dependent catalytic subunit
MDSTLPPGQHAISFLPRFGSLTYASRLPTASQTDLILGGHVTEPATLQLADLQELPRRSIRADFHCVATWTFRGLHWEGWALRDIFEAYIAPRSRLALDGGYLEFHGRDRYRTSVLLADALASNVVVADCLQGQLLTMEHGAPLRLVAPDLYGYKNVKHLWRIDLRPDFRAGRAERQTLAHSRARVAFEERGRGLPGWVYRPVYRALIRPTLWYYRRFEKSRRKGTDLSSAD